MKQSAGPHGPNEDGSARAADPEAPAPDAPDLDVRAAMTTMPIDEAAGAPTPPLGVAGAEGGWGGPDLVEAVYGPLTGTYERLDTRLRETPEDVPPAGWAPHIAALRAFRAQRVAGDWETLARLLVAPGSLTSATGQARLVEVEEDEAAAVRETVRALLATSERTLLLAPTQRKAEELLHGLADDPDIFPLLIETRPEAPSPPLADPLVEAGQNGPAEPVEPVEPAPRGDFGSNGTVEFRPITDPSEIPFAEPLAAPHAVPPDDTRPDETEPRGPAPGGPTLPGSPEPLRPAEDSAPETWVREAAVRAVGESWRQSWSAEARLLQRGLMWLEQWPRDAAALEAAQADDLRRREELEAGLAALAADIEAARELSAAAAKAAVDAEAEAERLVAVQDEAEAELAGPKAEAGRLQEVADATAAEAGERTRVADAAHARCAQLDQRAITAQSELRAARELEASLTDELARAREELPRAAEEANRLTAADADAAAEGHAAYYRLVSAESALSAMRRKMSLGQRLHVASPPSGLSGLRAEVKARTREADEAARRAKEAKDAAERAEARRQEIAAFVSDGGTRLATAKEAQERLGTELTWLATERETATADHREQARLAAEAVDRATQAGLAARAAQQAARVIEERLESARAAREAALATAVRARADAEAAAARAEEARAALERRTAEAEADLAARTVELQTATEAEARSRENVREICGSDPVEEPGLIATHQRQAMARIEQLTGYLEGGGAAGGAADRADGSPARTAGLVVGTPLGAGLALADEEFDALIVADAGAVTDAEFLIGAVRARRWILVGSLGARPTAYPEYTAFLEDTTPEHTPEDGAEAVAGDVAAGDIAERLALSPFTRAVTVAPALVTGRG
ncbi:hypothetical protein AGRA3207_003928 [Actinomadura graeca]|uniref:Uncharacterized protein n=1 Tax=Actinomadura graeca TaxID=2750812 RepID=A0ABX8QVU0_9ACTN|nr:hypothetical protein [Actinomadura graeca]QXJ22860.1 hypothetical protein AGRA3207_003928 [Actinomadura graeca]